MQFEEVLRTFADFFEREKFRYALAGGNALVAWGHQRLTYDVDFAVDGTQRLRIIAHAESLGYATTFASEAFSNHHHPSSAMGHVDFLYVYGQTADALFAAATRKDRAGIDLPVLPGASDRDESPGDEERAHASLDRCAGHRLPPVVAGHRPGPRSGVLYATRVVENLR